MINFLTKLSSGELISTEQNSEFVSYQPYPRAKDFVVNTNWTAQHAFNFMKATEVFGFNDQCKISSYTYLLDKALDYDNNDTLSDAEVKADTLYIPCNEGVLIASFTDKL